MGARAEAKKLTGIFAVTQANNDVTNLGNTRRKVADEFKTCFGSTTRTRQFGGREK